MQLADERPSPSTRARFDKPSSAGACVRFSQPMWQRRRQLRQRPQAHRQDVHGDSGEPDDAHFADLLRKRQLKRAGLGFSSLMLTAGGAAAATAGMAPPPEVVQLATLALVAAPALLAAAKLLLGDSLHVEWHDMRPVVEYAAVDTSHPRPSIEVRPTADGRGNGAFAAASIARGTFLGEYEGELLSERQYWSRYPSGTSDYCIRIDAEWTVDGIKRAQDTSGFSACHMNHASGKRSNVARQTFRRQKCVRFFAKRDIQAGEELLLDYGSIYWTGREDLLLE